MDAKGLFPRVLTASVHFGRSLPDDVVANVDLCRKTSGFVKFKKLCG